MKATQEQERTVELFSTEKSIKVNAYAGTGKTTTLRMLGRSTNRMGMYLAFNKSIATEAQGTFTGNVSCRTMHSLAFRAMISEIDNAVKMTSAIPSPHMIVSLLGLKSVKLPDHILRDRHIGFLISETIRRFLHSSHCEPMPNHMPTYGVLDSLGDADIEVVRKHVHENAVNLWNMMKDVKSDVPLGHDGYLKMWEITKPTIRSEFIMLDEAQDANPVMLSVMMNQTGQIVLVGDRYQQIYSWRGAINAMENINTANTSNLTESFRFGKDIAETATSILRMMGEYKPLIGSGRGEIERKQKAIICRTNAEVINRFILCLSANKKTNIVGGTDGIMRLLDGIERLQKGIPSDLPEFFGFADWFEVVDFSKSPEGDSLKTIVSIVQNRSINELKSFLLRNCKDEREADCIISTAHKSKGREWHTVEVDDALIPEVAQGKGIESVNKEALRLLYVSATRAINDLQLSQVARLRLRNLTNLSEERKNDN